MNTLMVIISATMSILPIAWTYWLLDRLEQEMRDRDPFVRLEVQCYCGRIFSVTHYEVIDKLSKNPPRQTLEYELFCCKDCQRTVWPLLSKTRWMARCLRFYYLKLADPEPRSLLLVKPQALEGHEQCPACGAETKGGFHV